MTWLTNIFNYVWSTEQIPEDWRKGIIIPFWKRKGDALPCSNYCGITLLSIPGKTFARFFIKRAIPAMYHHRTPHQAGFMPGRSTTDHISAIRLLAEEACEFRKDRALFITFIDLKAAFDSVDRDCLWHILHSIGIPPKIARLLEQLYTDTSSCIRINNNLSDWWFEYKTNMEVRTLTNRQPVQRYIAQGRLRWFGHLFRSPLNHPAHVIYTLNPRVAGWWRLREPLARDRVTSSAKF